ncbi:1-acyl-sn-glycerol-3-phosphate acyltransferase [Propionivibrio soli]|uniref:1-acyl-sn-glycerol-3-phosphate acyltransferase n=1 Tax=Propionivibrio soli TaxID=2976531 RepID=UPI0021E834E7|nr:1-acyl-sn-glycerol-3-phosphate acyltransferase [Propionivibrio soli]
MLRSLASMTLRLVGWHSVFEMPPGPKSVIVVYPHTSNWDFVLGVLCRVKHGVFLHWAGKDTLFRWPLRGFFLRLGGVPINRRERTGMIAQLAEALRREPTFHIAITPEGTRSKTDHWKSGFYRLALAADAPLGLGFIDYGTKRVGVERWIKLIGNEEADLALLRAYYADKKGLYPEKSGDIRFLPRPAEKSA